MTNNPTTKPKTTEPTKADRHGPDVDQQDHFDDIMRGLRLVLAAMYGEDAVNSSHSLGPAIWEMEKRIDELQEFGEGLADNDADDDDDDDNAEPVADEAAPPQRESEISRLTHEWAVLQAKRHLEVTEGGVLTGEAFDASEKRIDEIDNRMGEIVEAISEMEIDNATDALSVAVLLENSIGEEIEAQHDNYVANAVRPLAALRRWIAAKARAEDLTRVARSGFREALTP